MSSRCHILIIYPITAGRGWKWPHQQLCSVCVCVCKRGTYNNENSPLFLFLKINIPSDRSCSSVLPSSLSARFPDMTWSTKDCEVSIKWKLSKEVVCVALSLRVALSHPGCVEPLRRALWLCPSIIEGSTCSHGARQQSQPSVAQTGKRHWWPS